ncbi:uncharacterized protein BYT42DRAFT_545442 [Radiomyces spectabilis]|uniref:uncharacterized protein n=1 Tax=Radiomyces spectabilis TaxID=64574 RepID=UPI002220BD51|nr:uncharacterized protein BYT42DRAFT_545442 [Radiomyces spectabilis]KAI8381574.1 hypothetical protein BYT42DRAFT_545442 [Radiomyces spectabilis]
MKKNDELEDFANRMAKLKMDQDNSKTPVSDDELKNRFASVFSRQPISTQTSVSYHVPADFQDIDDKTLNELLDEAELWQNSDNESDQDILREVLHGSSLPNEKKSSSHITQNKLDALQNTFLRDERDTMDDEPTGDLLAQIKDEVQLENKYAAFAQQRDEELEKRYLQLKQNPPAALNFTADERESSYQTQGTNDSALRSSVPKPLQWNEIYDETDDWCSICNEDATLVCPSCEDEKYCKRCFVETHHGEMADYDATKHIPKAWSRRQQ